MTPVVGLATTLSKLTVIGALSRSLLALGGACGAASLDGAPEGAFDASEPEVPDFGTIVAGRICSGTSVLAVSGRLIIFGITGPPGAAAIGDVCGAGGGFTAGAGGAA